MNPGILMNRIKEFLNLNRWEIFSAGSLFIIFFLLMIVFGQHMGNAIIDCGREAYFPAEILKGKVLYKDIFNIFGPLSYQINALFYAVFGVNLKSLYFAGFLNANLIIFLLYFLARFFTSREISWVVTLFIIFLCVFNPWLFNYIFPYSYAMVYAFSSLLLSVFFLLLYFKTSKDLFMPLAWFFAGASIASKYDYLAYAFFLLILTIFKAPKDKKYLILSLISFFTVPVLSFLILFLQGLNLNEFLNQLQLIKIFALSSSLNYFYKTTVGLYPHKLLFLLSFKTFLKLAVPFCGLLLSIYFMFWNKYNPFIRLPLSFLLAGFFCYKLFSSVTLSPFIFCWLPLFTLLLLILFGVIFFKKLKGKYFLNTKDGMYLIFIFIGLLASIKSFFCLNIHMYGNFSLPLLLIINSIFVTEYLPVFLKFINKEVLKKSFFIVILSLAFLALGILYTAFSNYRPIYSKKGVLYAPGNIALPVNSLISYIEKKLNPNDVIWVIPEGIMVNFLGGHHSNGVYYALTPPYIETFGEDKIISDTKNNTPDYIIINNRCSSEYGFSYICEGYGLKICKHIKSSYVPVVTFGSGFKMVLYKRKEF